MMFKFCIFKSFRAFCKEQTLGLFIIFYEGVLFKIHKHNYKS